jgi:hypothetical protein
MVSKAVTTNECACPQVKHRKPMTSHAPPNPPTPPQPLTSRGIQPRFSEQVLEYRKLVMNRLAEHLSEVFGHVDDTLFECAEKAENNQVQSLFFDSMREIRRQRPQIERTYNQRIAHNFADFLEGRLTPAVSLAALDAEKLKLVQNDDFEESLHVINMVSRVKARCAQPLFALDQRLALLNNGQKLAEDANPFGPQAIAQAFRDALAPCPFALRIKAILYMLFDRYVMHGLDPVYAALNQQLIEAGVLPNLNYRAQATTHSSQPPTAASATRAKSAAQPPAPVNSSQGGRPPSNANNTAPVDLNGPPSNDPAVLFSGLAAMLDEHRQRANSGPLPDGTRSMDSYAPRGATRRYSIGELLEALDRLQQQAGRDWSQRRHQPQAVNGLKTDLQQQLESHSHLPGQQKLSDPQADVVDLVGMLFDFILDDQHLPSSYKIALSYLHAPYLHIALQGKALFIQHRHPARRLLNVMVQAALLYGDEGEDGGLLRKIQWVVEQLIQGRTGDLQLFDSLLREFKEFAVTLKYKVELRERRAVQAAKGRDKLLSARQQAAELINRTLTSHPPPELIRTFLQKNWADVLVFVQLRHGQGPEWQRAAEVAEQLAWSGTALDQTGRQRLHALRKALFDDLRKGLELLGGNSADAIRRQLQALLSEQNALHSKQNALHSKQPETAAAVAPVMPPPHSSVGMLVDTEAAQASGLSPQAQLIAEQLGQVAIGSWFEFVLGEQTHRLKLSWFSPITHNYLFVDQSGQHAAIKSLSLLASEMEQGLARLAISQPGTPLMDRALQGIYRVLQRLSPRAKPR